MTTSQPPGQHYSPDGRFWWDGTGWRPVDAGPSGQPPGQPGPAQFQPPYGPAGQPPTGPAAPASHPPYGPAGQPPTGPATPPSASHPPYPADRPGPGRPPGAPGLPGFPGPGLPRPPGAVPRPPGKAGFILALVATAVLSGLLGGLAGGITGLLTTEPPGSDTPPPVAADFPTAERQYMTGVTLAVVAEDWMKKANSWNCADDGELESFSQAKKTMRCTAPDDEGDADVTIEYDEDDKVKLVSANCSAGLKSNLCKTLAATLADTVLSPQGDQLRKKAAKWAAENTGSERVTTIGGIRLEASLDPNGMTATPGI